MFDRFFVSMAPSSQESEPPGKREAVPDHSCLKGSDRAAAGIGMTVAEWGESDGTLTEVLAESALDTDIPTVDLKRPQTPACPRNDRARFVKENAV